MVGTNWQWIPSWTKEDDREARKILFRKKVELEKVPDQCILQVSADSRYKLYINGRFVQAGPAKGNQQSWYYERIPVTGYLRRGSNVLAVEILRYPTEHGKGNFSVFRTKIPGMYIKEEGTKVLETEKGWKCRQDTGFQIVSENPYFAPLQILEKVDGRKKLIGWKTDPEYQETGWEDARRYTKEEMELEPELLHMEERTIPLEKRQPGKFACIEQIVQSDVPESEWNEFLQKQKPVRIQPQRKEIIEINTGEIRTAYLSLALGQGKGSRITILEAECYGGKIREHEDPFKRMPVKGDRTDHKNGKLYGFTDTYQAAGNGSREKPEIYEPFWFRTFRFIRLEIETGEEPLDLFSFGYEETGYPLQVQAKVETSDASMQPIWEICEKTLRRCMHDTYMDCPFYEQMQYAMDTRSQILYTYAIAGDDRLARKAIRDFGESIHEDGLLNSCAPDYEKHVIPGFSIYYIGMLYDHMMYVGDKEFLLQYLPVAEKILDFFESHTDFRKIVGKIGGLNRPGQYWSFIDWTPEWDKTNGVPPATLEGPITMESLLYLYGLQCSVKLWEYVGETKKAEELRERAERIRQGLQQCCIGRKGMFLDGPGIETYSQHTQVFAILTGMVSPEEGKKILTETLEHKEQYAQCSVAMMFYLFRALEICDLYDYTDQLWEIWREMIRKHMTTCVEDLLEERSDCHAWGAVALYELPAVVLGVRPAKPGWEEIEISPRTGKMKWARGEVPTRKGKVAVSWIKKGEDMELEIRYPKGAKLKLQERNVAIEKIIKKEWEEEK